MACLRGPLGDKTHILQQTGLLRASSSCTQTLQPPIEPDVLVHSQPAAMANTVAIVAGRVPGAPSPHSSTLYPRPSKTHMSNSTLYCGQTPRWGRMASMLDWTLWPRMQAEPRVGGKRPLSMDLRMKGSQSSCPSEEETETPREGAKALKGHLVSAGPKVYYVPTLQRRETEAQRT